MEMRIKMDGRELWYDELTGVWRYTDNYEPIKPYINPYFDTMISIDTDGIFRNIVRNMQEPTLFLEEEEEDEDDEITPEDVRSKLFKAISDKLSEDRFNLSSDELLDLSRAYNELLR